MANKRVFGYADPLNPKAGKDVKFYVSAEGTDVVDAKIVKLIHGSEDPSGPGFIEREIKTSLPEKIEVERQYSQFGSFLVASDPLRELDGLKEFTLFTYFQPTSLKAKRQVLMGQWDIVEQKGYALGITPDGYASLWMGDGEKVDQINSDVPLVENCWYFLAATYSYLTKKATLYLKGCVNPWNSQVSTVTPYDLGGWTEETMRVVPAKTRYKVKFVVGGAADRVDHVGNFVNLVFNGKIDRSGIYKRVVTERTITRLSRLDKRRRRRRVKKPKRKGLRALWDPTDNITKDGVGDLVMDTSGSGFHLFGVNRPLRLTPGINWRGADSFHVDPNQFGGVRLNDDAIVECYWDRTVTLRIPEDLPSGVYALRLRSDGVEEHIPFIVTPKKPTADLAVLLPTMTYLAYANDHTTYEHSKSEAAAHSVAVISEADLEYKKLGEFGMSTYDTHSDGSGVCHSSWRRPIISLRPKFRHPTFDIPWGLSADLSLLWWLEKEGCDFDVLTDHNLHHRTRNCLKKYKTVISGARPEYCTTRMYDRLERYLMKGGRFIYAGGQGFYWSTGVRFGEKHCIEVRKPEAGSRSWQSAPGEGYLASTGERSGLWRNRGRSAHKLVGVGFAAQGSDGATSFEAMPDSAHKRTAWILEGVDDPTSIGRAGCQLDRYDAALGTPPHAVIVASSAGHGHGYKVAQEDVIHNIDGRDGSNDHKVRADMVFFTTPMGGAVFSAGSATTLQSLPLKNGQNDMATVFRNVLKAFLAEGPLPGVEYTGDEKLWQ